MRPVLLCTTASLLVVLVASAQPPAPAEALVRKLGDAEPVVREQAAGELRGLGKAAIDALSVGLKDDDAEIRRACTDLLAEINGDRGPRVEAFLNGAEADPPFPGWAAFKKIAGDDRATRVAYQDLLHANPALFDQLEKDPKRLAGQTTELCTRLWNRQGPVRPNETRTEMILTALVAAALEPAQHPEGFNAFTTMLYQPDVRQVVAQNAMARRLVTRVLTARAGEDPNQLLQTAYLASNLNLHDYIAGTLTPAALKLVDSLGENVTDVNRINQVVNLVQAARLAPALRPKLTPLVRKLADAAAQTVEKGTAFNDANLLYQATNACQSLGLTDVADEVLKPAVRKMILSVAEKPEDINRFHQAINLARTLRLEDELNQTLQPAICRLIADVARNPADENRLQQAYNLAQQLNLNEAIEGALRPAARQRILAVLEQPPDINRFTQAVYQARNLQLNDLVEDTLKPVFARQAAALLEQPDFNKVQQLYHLSLNLGGGKITEETIKPAFVKQLKAMEKQPLNNPNLQQCLAMARQVGLTNEVLPLARRAALAKEAQGYVRGQAILLVVEFGTKEDRAALEPLLTDTTSLGSMGLNQMTLKAQVRDVVLGGLAFQRGKSLADFGFPYFKVIQQIRPFDTNASALGFASDEERQAAFKKWDALKAEKTEDDK